MFAPPEEHNNRTHLTLSQKSPGFHISFENTVGKGEIASKKEFLLIPQCFLPFCRTSVIFIKTEIVVCKLFQFGRVQNSLFREGLRARIF